MSCPTEKMHLDRRVPIFKNGTPMINNPYEKGKFFNPIDKGGMVIRMKDGTARIFAKITEFPVSNDCQYAGESMYVLLDVIVPKLTSDEQLQILLDKHIHDGTGILVNHPKYCTAVKYGERIRFKNGSKGIKAIFDSKLESMYK